MLMITKNFVYVQQLVKRICKTSPTFLYVDIFMLKSQFGYCCRNNYQNSQEIYNFGVEEFSQFLTKKHSTTRAFVCYVKPSHLSYFTSSSSRHACMEVRLSYIAQHGSCTLSRIHTTLRRKQDSSGELQSLYLMALL